jgi:hypothetical protein
MFGIGGVGKSHLLHASSTFAAQNGKTSLCLSCSELKNLSIEVLDGLERIDLICLDDLEFIAGSIYGSKAYLICLIVWLKTIKNCLSLAIKVQTNLALPCRIWYHALAGVTPSKSKP